MFEAIKKWYLDLQGMKDEKRFVVAQIWKLDEKKSSHLRTFNWIHQVLFCHHHWVKSAVSKWNEEHGSTMEADSRIVYCTKCPMALKVVEWEEAL